MNERYQKVKVASILGLIGNLFLMIIKGIVGFITSSQAMIADAFNSAGDIFSSVMTFMGNKIASKPRDKDHNLGHGKAEYIYSMLISLVMMLMALKSLNDSVTSLIKPVDYIYSNWLVIVCVIGISVKLVLFVYTNYLAKKYTNLLIKANSKDHRNDVLLTMFTLIASILGNYGVNFIDGVVGIGISIWIMITAISIYKESYDVLMDKSIADETKKKVYEIIKSKEEIKKISHFNSTPVGYQYQISFTIYVDGELTTRESHEIADKLEDEIIDNIEEIYLVVIHVNPINLK